MAITLKRHPGILVLTRGDFELGCRCGRDWHRDRGASLGIAWGRAAHARPQYTAPDYTVQVSFSWPLLCLAWHYDEDLASSWTGRKWSLYSWSWQWPRFSVETPTRYRAWPALHYRHLVRRSGG